MDLALGIASHSRLCLRIVLLHEWLVLMSAPHIRPPPGWQPSQEDAVSSAISAMINKMPSSSFMKLQEALQKTPGARVRVGTFFSGCELFTIVLQKVLKKVDGLFRISWDPELVFVADKDRWKRDFIKERMEPYLVFGRELGRPGPMRFQFHPY